MKIIKGLGLKDYSVFYKKKGGKTPFFYFISFDSINV